MIPFLLYALAAEQDPTTGEGPTGAPSNVSRVLEGNGKYTATWTNTDPSAASYIYMAGGATYIGEAAVGESSFGTGRTSLVGLLAVSHYRNGIESEKTQEED